MKCVRCGKEALVITLAYNGESLGPNCFGEVFERRVRKTIRKGKMLRFDDVTAIALSGGVCSSVLLYLIKNFSSRKAKAHVFALTVDDGLADVKWAAKLCRKLSVQHHIIGGGKSLVKEAGKLGASKIAYGVNLDDKACEALGRFLGGELKPEKEKTVLPVIHPLRECPIEEIELFAKIKKIPHSKSKKEDDEVAVIVDKIEEKHPGARFQIMSSLNYIEELFNAD